MLYIVHNPKIWDHNCPIGTSDVLRAFQRNGVTLLTYDSFMKQEFSNEDSIIVNGRNDVEKIILVGEKTTIKSLNNNVNISDLKVDDDVVIIGEPNSDGQIDAALIRVMPF